MDKKIKILEILPDIGSGGAERLVLDICRLIDKSKFEILLVSLYGESSCADIYRDSLKNIRCVFLDKKPGIDFSMISKLKRLIRNEKPHIVHSHLYATLYAAAAALLCRVPRIIHTVHTLAQNELGFLHKKLISYFYHHQKLVPVAISPAVARSIAEVYKLQPGKIVTINNGVDLSRFLNYRDKIPHDDIRFISVGRFSKDKNHRLLINAFSKVHKAYPSTFLYLLGDGVLKPQIEAQISELGLSDCVFSPGVMQNVEDYFKESDIFVLSSDYEGFGLVLIEAMSAGLPVVATKSGGPQDIITDGVEGYLTEVGNEAMLAERMVSLIESASTRTDMSLKAISRAADFDISKTVLQYEELFLR